MWKLHFSSVLNHVKDNSEQEEVACGVDGLVDKSIFIYTLVNSFLSHGYLPDAFILRLMMQVISISIDILPLSLQC